MNHRSSNHRISRPLPLVRVLLIALGASSTPALGQWSSMALPTANGATVAASVGNEALFTDGSAVDIWNEATGTWSSTTLSTPRAVSGMAAVSVDGLALFAGGGSSVVEVYDSRSGSWSTASLSAARSGLAATAVGGKALFAGGTYPSSSVVDIFDAATQTWSTASLSQARGEMAATSVGTKALFAGGAGSSFVSDVVDVYDDSTGSWSVMRLDVPRAWLSATSVGPLAFFAGGEGWNPESLVEIYDDRTGTWSKARLSSHRSDLQATSSGTKAFFGPGAENLAGQIFTVVDVFDTATGEWTSTNLPAIGAEAGCTAIGGKVLFGGGLLYCSLCPSIPSRGVTVFDDTIGGTYCSPAVSNSTGVSASLRVDGFPGTAIQGYAVLTARDLPPGSTGYFLVSMDQGFSPQPGGSQGNLCLGGAVGRYVDDSFVGDASGRAALQVDLTCTPTAQGHVAVSSGQTWQFQAWYRDANPSPASNFTDAVSVTFL